MALDSAHRLLEKLREFVTEQLDDDERALFAALIAPGVARAYTEADVSGFAMVEWEPRTLPQALVDALREAGVRVDGLGL